MSRRMASDLLLRLVLGGWIACAVWVASTAVGGNLAGVLEAVLVAAAPLVPLTLGAAIVVAAGDVDLSVGGAVSMHGTLVLAMSGLGWDLNAALVASLVIGCAVGTLNGLLVTKLGLSSLVVTLGVGMVCAGVALWFDALLVGRAMAAIGASEAPVVSRSLPESFGASAFESEGLWAIGLIVIVAAWRYFTLSGIRHLAVGSDRVAATSAVVQVNRIRLSAFVVNGGLAWLSAMLLMIGFGGGGWNPGSGRGLELVAIVVAVLGGTRITGGFLDPFAVALATLLWVALSQLQYVVPALGPETQLLFTGIMVIVVVALQSRNGIRVA